jgi:conserved hypothetical protein
MGLAASLATLLIIMKLSETPPSEVSTLSASLLYLFILLALVRVLAQGLRFYVLVRRYASIRLGLGKAVLIRTISEFFALTTVPFIADEAVRVVLLREMGERVSTAIWIAVSELVMDVFFGGTVACLAGLLAFHSGSHALGATILLISAFQLSAVLTLIRIATHRENALAAATLRLVRRNALTRKIFSRTIGQLFSEGPLAGASLFRDKSTLVLLAPLTAVVMTVPALTLYVISPETGVLGSLLAFHAGSSIGVIPITVGGSGLTEAGVFLYAEGVLGVGSWAKVIVWRIATYYLTLLMTGMSLLVYSLGPSWIRSRQDSAAP